MRIDELKAFVARLSYKPGWRFSVEQNMVRDEIVIEYSVQSVKHKSDTVTFILRVGVADGRIDSATDQRAILDAIAQQVLWAETHELLEHYRLDGESVYPAHMYGPDPVRNIMPHQYVMADAWDLLQEGMPR